MSLLFNQRPRLFPRWWGPPTGQAWDTKAKGRSVSSVAPTAWVLATSGHPVPAQPLRTVKTWPFSGFQQDTIPTFQNEDSAFLTHKSFENLMTVQVLSPEKCISTHECGQWQKACGLF